MIASELRLGNLVAVNGIYKEVNVYYIENAHLITPITLTEEFLLKFSYDKRQRGKVFEYYNYPTMIRELSLVCFGHESRVKPLKSVKYVHELQNIYFALTDSELKIKTEKL